MDTVSVEIDISGFIAYHVALGAIVVADGLARGIPKRKSRISAADSNSSIDQF